MQKLFFEKYKTSEVTNTRSVINTPSAFTRKNFFHIQEAGYLKSLKSYLFFVVLSGSGEVTYREPLSEGGMISSTAHAGDCFFLDCSGEYTHISTDEDPWELLWIHFNGPEARAYYTYFRDHHNWHFRSAHFTELINAIESIIRYNEEPTDDTDLLTAQQIIHILTLICTESNEKNELLSDKLKTILHYLDEHYTENISLDQLAEQFFIFHGNLKRNSERRSYSMCWQKGSIMPRSCFGTAILRLRRLRTCVGSMMRVILIRCSGRWRGVRRRSTGNAGRSEWLGRGETPGQDYKSQVGGRVL